MVLSFYANSYPIEVFILHIKSSIMKKGFFVAALAAILFLQGNSLPSLRHSSPVAATAPTATHNSSFVAAPASQQMRVTYSWYADPSFISWTGYVNTVTAELNRLRSLYAGYTFSASSGPGLIGFEWGYSSGFPTAVIYSDYY